MNKHNRILRSVLVAGTLGMASCNQSKPPEVAVAPIEAASDVTLAPGVKGEPEAKEPPVDPKTPIPNGGTFPFADDAAGQALEKVVTPSLPPSATKGEKLTRRERTLPAYLDSPSPRLPDSAGTPPRLSLPPPPAPRPTALPDPVPLDFGEREPQLPPRLELPTGPLTRTEGRDVNLPADLPLLSPKPVPDRASLEDPTLEFTARSVISSKLPLRTEPTGFVRINLPDPFEFSKEAMPRTPVVEDPNRVLGNPPPPR